MFCFFESVSESESVGSFSSISLWSGQYTILMFCSFGLHVFEILWKCSYSGVMISFLCFERLWLELLTGWEKICGDYQLRVKGCLCHILLLFLLPLIIFLQLDPMHFSAFAIFIGVLFWPCFWMITPDPVGQGFWWADASVTIMVLLAPVHMM